MKNEKKIKTISEIQNEAKEKMRENNLKNFKEIVEILTCGIGLYIFYLMYKFYQ